MAIETLLIAAEAAWGRRMSADVIVRDLDGSFRLEVRNEAAFAIDATAPSIRYAREYHVQNEYRASSCHGLICSSEAGFHASVILCAGGGTTGVHDRSLCASGGRCFVAVGPYVIGLSLPSLEVLWSTQVDCATCFGIHPTLDGKSLISHGELAVARITLFGGILWTASGADIFSGSLAVTRTEVHVEDFNRDSYVFDIETGAVIASTA